MHEMSLVRPLIKIITEEAEAAGVEKITAVHLVIGEDRDIVMHLLESMFQFMARGTVAENAKVVVQHVPYMVKCNQCQTEFHLDVMQPEKWACPHCGAYKDYKQVSGNEFYISKLEAPKKNSAAQKEGTPE